MTTNISMAQSAEYTFTGRIDIAVSFKRDKDSADKKSITLDVGFEGETLDGIVRSAAKSAVVPWQNHLGRPKFDEWENGQRVKVSWSKPATAYVDPEVAMVNRLKAMDSPEKKEAYIQELLAKAGA